MRRICEGMRRRRVSEKNRAKEEEEEKAELTIESVIFPATNSTTTEI